MRKVPEFVVINQFIQLYENTAILKINSLLTLGSNQHFSSHIVCKPLELILREVNITHVIYPLASIVINDRCLLSFSVMQI